MYFCIKRKKRKRVGFCGRKKKKMVFVRVKSPKSSPRESPAGPRSQVWPKKPSCLHRHVSPSRPASPAASRLRNPEEAQSSVIRQTRSAITSKPLPRVAISLLTHGSQKPSRVSRGCLQSTRSTRESRRQVSTPEQPLAPLA